MKNLTKFSSLLFAGIISSAMAAPDAQTQAFLNKLNTSGGKPMEQLSPNDARQVLVNAQNSVKTDISGIDVQQKTITVDGKPLGLTIVRPTNTANKTLPVFMFFHGGGWVLGDFKTHERLIRDLVIASGAAAVYVDYSRSPEAHYPVALNQAYAATKWVAEHGKEINVDGQKLAVVGNSVGGNMAAAVALMAKEKGKPAIKFQVLLWPVTNANFESASYNEFAKDHFLTKNMMKWFWDSYTTDPKQRAEIFASPLRATSDELKGLPPALVIVAENDVLRDEGEAYANKLDGAGVSVISVRYNGMIHDFGLLNPLSTVPGTQAAMTQAGVELKKHLQ
jgi:acetyl esterase/lipase